MRIVKGLKNWISDYEEVRLMSEELQLAYDYNKEGITTEEEVDEAYKRLSNYSKILNSRTCFEKKKINWVQYLK